MSFFINKLDLKDKLNLPDELTYGVEIEFEYAKYSSVKNVLEMLKEKNCVSEGWRLKSEPSLENGEYSGELSSPIFNDRQESYIEIENICQVLRYMDGRNTRRCAGHIHIGANILENNVDYYVRLAKLWTVFEAEIIRFGLGEYETSRDTMSKYAESSAPLLRHVEKFELGLFGNYSFENFVKCFGFEKKMAISFFYLKEDKPFHTIEIRCPNGTLDPRIWKNNINFFTKLILACRDNTKDWKKIITMYHKIKNKCDSSAEISSDIEKAKFLAEFVFDDEKDISNFMLQYKKDSSKYLVR